MCSRPAATTMHAVTAHGRPAAKYACKIARSVISSTRPVTNTNTAATTAAPASRSRCAEALHTSFPPTWSYRQFSMGTSQAAVQCCNMCSHMPVSSELFSRHCLLKRLLPGRHLAHERTRQRARISIYGRPAEAAGRWIRAECAARQVGQP